MKLKLFILLAISLSYAALMFSSCTSLSACRDNRSPGCMMLGSGSDDPHAVDISGKVIPLSSAVQPDKPIILAKDSQDLERGEFSPATAFDHKKHATDVLHSIDGKTVTACVECHHTAQPSAPKGQEYLTKFERKEILTAKQLETSNEPVRSCRACHLQETEDETDEYPPEGVKYPKKMKRDPTGKLTNRVAYHINCNSCHDAVLNRDPKSKAPSECSHCHT